MRKNYILTDLFYSKFVFKESLDPVIDKLLAHDRKLQQLAKNVAIRVKFRKILLKGLLEKKKTLASSAAEREKLAKQWIFDKAKAVEDDPKYLVLSEIRDWKLRTEAFMLFGLIEKHLGGRQVAMKLFKECDKGGSFNMQKLKEYFTRGRTDRKLGFYYGTRKIKWYANKSWRQAYNKDTRKVETSWWLVRKVTDWNYLNVSVRGWWAHDNDEDSKNTLKGGKSFDSYALGPNGKLRGGGYGDEWLGSNFFAAKKYIGKELRPRNAKNLKPGERDSGMSPKKEGAVLDSLADLYKEAMTDKWTVKEKLYRWFTKEQPQNQWIILPKHKIGQMNLVFGRGCGNYRYRVVGNKIYFLAIKGANFDVKYGIGGYISLKSNSLGTWYSSNTKEASITSFSKQLKKDVLDKMTSQTMRLELGKTESMQSSTVIKGKELVPTQKAMSHILDEKNYKKFGLPANFQYKEKAMYFKKTREALKKYLINEGYKDDKSGKLDAYVEARATKVEGDMESYITGNNALKDVIKPNSRLRLKVNAANQVQVKVEDKKTKMALKKREAEIAAKKAKDNVPENPEKGMIKKVKAKITNYVEATINKYIARNPKLEKYKKYVGLVASKITDAISELMDLPNSIAELAKSPQLRKLLPGFLGGGAVGAALILRKKGLSKKTFEENIIKEKRYIFSQKLRVPEELDLKRGKIIIKDGKNFDPVVGMKIRVGSGPVEPVPKDKSKWGKYKGKKITIVGKAPKSLIIKRGFEWQKG